jgi:hypothetical protein
MQRLTKIGAVDLGQTCLTKEKVKHQESHIQSLSARLLSLPKCLPKNKFNTEDKGAR